MAEPTPPHIPLDHDGDRTYGPHLDEQGNCLCWCEYCWLPGDPEGRCVCKDCKQQHGKHLFSRP